MPTEETLMWNIFSTIESLNHPICNLRNHKEATKKKHLINLLSRYIPHPRRTEIDFYMSNFFFSHARLLLTWLVFLNGCLQFEAHLTWKEDFKSLNRHLNPNAWQIMALLKGQINVSAFVCERINKVKIQKSIKDSTCYKTHFNLIYDRVLL